MKRTPPATIAETTMRDGPLGGVRVIDLTSVVMGPFATHILADLGADVIKVEAPEGDSFRSYRPYRNEGMSGSFLHLNRNKRSVMLDLKQAAARRHLDALIATADVFVHALRPRAIAKLGYTYERVRELNPDIIYCGAYGFGTDGPYRDKAAYDDLIQAGSGLASLATAVRSEPAYLPTVLCDKLAGQTIAYSIIAGLFKRERGGGGDVIEVPMFETSIEFAMIEHMGGSAFEPPLGAAGFHRVLTPYRKPYRTKDAFACILPYSDKNWQDFFRFTNRLEFASDERFKTLQDRVVYIDVLYRMIEEEAPRFTTQEWVDFCDEVSIPCMPVMSLDEVADDEHVRSVKLFDSDEHPSEGSYRVLRHPVKFGATSFRVRRHAPRLGEHTQAVLAELTRYVAEEGDRE